MNQYNGRLRQCVHLGGFRHAEQVMVALAPLMVTLSKSVLTAAADAVNMPEVMGEIHPFLCSVATYRAVKELTDTGEGLFLKRNQVVCHSGFLLGSQLELTV